MSSWLSSGWDIILPAIYTRDGIGIYSTVLAGQTVLFPYCGNCDWTLFSGVEGVACACFVEDISLPRVNFVGSVPDFKFVVNEDRWFGLSADFEVRMMSAWICSWTGLASDDFLISVSVDV